MPKQASIFLAGLFWSTSLTAALLNGPMVTHTTMQTVQVWAQTDGEDTVQLEYWKADEPDTKWRSQPIKASYENGFVTKLLAHDGIEPGQSYRYQILIDDEIAAYPQFRDGYSEKGDIPLFFQSKPRWRWIPDQETQAKHSVFDFRIAMGSCTYINQQGTDREGGKPYGSNYQIFETIYEKQPDLMLWLGDNVYYRENEFESREGMIARWTHDRQTPEMRALFANSIHYSTWDDHDFGPNNIGRNYWLKDKATEVFQLMWGNPSAGLPETPGIFTYVNWGDVNIYFLDNRTYLSPSESSPESFGKAKSMLGKAQADWLIEHLAWAQSQSAHDSKSYPARFNLIVVGSQVLSQSTNPDNYRNYPEEWTYLMDRIVAEKIRGVVFLSGDVHFGEVNKVEHTWNSKSATFYEVTSSPLTAGASSRGSKNEARLDIFEGTPNRAVTNNFVTLDFVGQLNDRKMVIRYWDSDGNLLNQKSTAQPGTPTDLSIISANEITPE